MPDRRPPPGQRWLDSCTEPLADLVAPAMPWLFLTLRRALIPTVCLIVLAVLFYGVPQSSEVLLGLTEPSTEGLAPGSPFAAVNIYPLTWYVIWSILLAVAIWYSARLLCTVEAWLGMPLAWEILNLGPHMRRAGKHRTPSGLATEMRVVKAIKWLPRAYGVAALAAAMGALIYAPLIVSTMSRPLALALVASIVATPLIAAIGALHWMIRQPPLDTWSPKLTIAGLLGYVVSSILLATRINPTAIASVEAVRIVDIVCALLPALMLMVLVLRRRVTRRVYRMLRLRRIRRVRGTSRIERLRRRPYTYDLFESHHAVKFEEVFTQVMAFIALGALGLIVLGSLSAKHVRSIGSLGTIMLFLAAAIVFVSGSQLFLRRVSRAVPGFTSAFAIGVVVVLQYLAHEPLGDERFDDGASQAAANAIPRYANAAGGTLAQPVSLQSADAPPPDAPPPGPHILVNAYGGGLRAAIYTAQTLALADDASCGKFGTHLHAMSGVSGGSLGIAVYLVARQRLVAQGAWTNCNPAKDTPLTDVVTQALVQDHLSPVIATFLSRDVFLRTPLTPHASATRGQAMLESWDDALAEAFEESHVARPADERNRLHPLALPLADLTGGIAPAPRVFFNTTDADSGNNEWFSNGVGGQATATCPQPTRYSSFEDCGPRGRFDLTVGEAVLHSARFPIVTPAGDYSEFDKRHRLVDGGYADNSGAQTLSLQVLTAARHDFGKDIVLLDINGNPPELGVEDKTSANDPARPVSRCEQAGRQAESSVPTSLLALFQTRAARAEDAVKRLAQWVPECEGLTIQQCLKPIQLNLERIHDIRQINDPRCDQIERARTAPLGWYTGASASRLVRKSSQDGALDVCTRAKLDCVFASRPLDGEVGSYVQAQVGGQ